MILLAILLLIGLAYLFLNGWVMIRWLKRKVKTKSFLWFFVVTSILYLAILFWNRKSIEFWLDTKRIEKEVTYPGEIKVTVVRESRFTEFAR